MMSEMTAKKKDYKRQNVHTFLDLECGVKLVKTLEGFFCFVSFKWLVGASLQGITSKSSLYFASHFLCILPFPL